MKPASRPSAPDLPISNEGLPLDKFHHVRLNMRAYDAVRSDDLACLAVDIVPIASNLRTQPALEWSKMFAKSFAACVRSTYSFTLRQQVIGQIRPAALLLWT